MFVVSIKRNTLINTAAFAIKTYVVNTYYSRRADEILMRTTTYVCAKKFEFLLKKKQKKTKTSDLE